MEDSKVKAVVCNGCGAEIRGGSVYCYNCGGEIANIKSGVESIDAIPAIPKPLVETLKAELETSEANGSASQTQTEPIEKRAEIRRPRSAFARRERKPTEVVWEQKPESGLRFLALTLLLVFVAVALLVTAMYLR